MAHRRQKWSCRNNLKAAQNVVGNCNFLSPLRASSRSQVSCYYLLSALIFFFFFAFCPKALWPKELNLQKVLLEKGTEDSSPHFPCFKLKVKCRHSDPLHEHPQRLCRAAHKHSALASCLSFCFGQEWGRKQRELREWAESSQNRGSQLGSQSHLPFWQVYANCILASCKWQWFLGFKKIWHCILIVVLLVSSSTGKEEGLVGLGANNDFAGGRVDDILQGSRPWQRVTFLTSQQVWL